MAPVLSYLLHPTSHHYHGRHSIWRRVNCEFMWGRVRVNPLKTSQYISEVVEGKSGIIIIIVISSDLTPDNAAITNIIYPPRGDPQTNHTVKDFESNLFHWLTLSQRNKWKTFRDCLTEWRGNILCLIFCCSLSRVNYSNISEALSRVMS